MGRMIVSLIVACQITKFFRKCSSKHGITGPCRIPTFGSRIPQISTKSQPVALQSPSPVSELTEKHIGKKVRVGEKDGILKYVGSVHFAKGVWCGIELTGAIGKNDGIVNGVRYFACSKFRGLMAPLAKVTLVDGSCESIHEDNASGPYSILCLDPKLPNSTFTSQANVNRCDNTTNCTYNLQKDNQNCQNNGGDNNLEQHCTYNLGNKTNSVDNLSHFGSTEHIFIKNHTFDIQNNTRSTEDLRRLVFKDKRLNKNCSHTSINSIGSHSEDDKHWKNTTFDLKFNRTCSIESIPSNQSYILSRGPVNTTYDLKNCKDLTISAEDLNHTCTNITQTIHTRKVNTDLTTPSELPNNANSIENLPCPIRRNTHEIEKLKDDTLTFFSNLKKRTNDTFKYDNDSDENIESILNSKKVKSPLVEALPYLPINKSCEDLLNESTTEVKRRRTSNPKCHKPDGALHKPQPLDKPSSLPQLRASHHLNGNKSPNNSLLNLKQLHSTPVRIDFFEDLRKLRFSGISAEKDDDSNKRDSLDCEESLGILTPDQMDDFTQTLSPSLEYNPLVSNIKLLTEEKLVSPSVEVKKGSFVLSGLTVDMSKVRDGKEEVQSPNLTSVTEYSLGIIDADQIASAFTILKTDTTMNLELPLDSIANHDNNFTLTRCDQTPSPEELPLDTTPIVESEPSKTESTAKSKTSNSFITSITSITSLDTGYQGDGEMSRPASRGADNSPLTRRPFPRPQPRRPDPMTDSDFYTESDADNHEDNQLKGDRRAQVIDGTLYGVDPQAAADIYVNNRENMDSSGVFTDIESGLRNDDEIENDHPHDNNNPQHINNNQTADVSPSDSSKTISENSQNNVQEILQKSTETNQLIDSSLDKTIKENPKKRNAPSPGISSPSSLSSPRHQSKEENAAKKYKMPNRDVASKVKAMLEPNQSPSGEKKLLKKPVNRWDAVMNKISKNEQNKTNLKEIKSKVFGGVSLSNSSSSPRIIEQRKATSRPVVNQNNKSRRVRTRTTHNSSPLKKVVGSNIESSIHSSLSDLSTSIAPPKKSPGAAKKRDAIQVTQVLTPNKLTSRNQQTLTENKKNANNISPSSSNDIKAKRTIFSPKEKKQQTLVKESNKPTVKGGRTSPSVRPPAPQTPRAPVKRAPPTPRAAEALAVLVQHLVFNVEAYQVPYLRRQVEKFRLEAEEIRLAYQHLEETLVDEKVQQAAAIEEERIRCRKDITELIEKHRNQIAQLTSQHKEEEEQLRLEKDTAQQYLTKKHEEQLATLRQELEKLQRSHEESLDILREENESIREQIDEKRLELEKANHESLKLKQDYECKEIKLKEEVEVINSQRNKFKFQIEQLERDFQEKLKSFIEENKRLREENDRLLSYGDDKDIGMQEVRSLRVVLELKQNEVADLRKTLGQANQKLEILIGAEEKASALQARCEDLQHQLQRKGEYEQTLIQENHRLNESFKEEVNQKRRLNQYNEELQWKLRQNKEVITKVMEQAEESAFNRSNIFSSSFNEKHNASKVNLERTLSFRESSYCNKSNSSLEGSSRGRKSKNSIDCDDDLSPPSSPKVKGVVEKSDSVSYVLDLDESPEVVASRIVRRSFRNTTPPKNTPTKSPSNKRPRIRNPLSMSASSSSIIPLNKEDCERPRSASARNGNFDDDVFLWTNSQSSTPKNYDMDKLNHSCESIRSRMKLDDNLELDEDNEVDLQLPALPNEMDKRNGVLALPSPKRLASDAAASDSNSEDESTSSSQL